MKTSKDNQDYEFNDPEWYFLAEYPLDKLPADLEDRPEAGLLFQTITGLGMDPELLNNIERMLIGLVREVMEQRNYGRYEPPPNIRLFLQKKTVDGATLFKSTIQFEAKQTKNSTQIIHHSGPVINGGWGYFLVERGGRFQPSSPRNAYCEVDLYIYKEGE